MISRVLGALWWLLRVFLYASLVVLWLIIFC